MFRLPLVVKMTMKMIMMMRMRIRMRLTLIWITMGDDNDYNSVEKMMPEKINDVEQD